MLRRLHVWLQGGRWVGLDASVSSFEGVVVGGLDAQFGEE